MERLEKAKLISLETKETFPFQFNPEEYTITKKILWKQTPIKGKSNGETEHSGGQPATFTLKLLFDSTQLGVDVRTQYEVLLLMAEPQSLIPFITRKEPPKVRFVWGTIVSFTAVITNITQRFTMFLGNGMPVRARVEVTLQEVKDEKAEKPQNPTSRSEPRKTRRVELGSRLDLIAYEEYGDANRWLDIAEANDLEDPLRLEPGQILTIPIDYR